MLSPEAAPSPLQKRWGKCPTCPNGSYAPDICIAIALDKANIMANTCKV